MTRLLVTGASGLLGLTVGLQTAARHDVTGLVLSHGLKGVPFQTFSADLAEPGEAVRVIEMVRPQVVIHCAALANLDVCEQHPDTARRVNAEVPGELAELAQKHSFKLVHISTDAVFDGVKGDYSETDEPHPLSVYAETKLAGEQAVLSANPLALVARVNFFGWSLYGQRSLAEWFFNNLSLGKQVNGFTDVFFCPLLVNTLADTLMEMVEKNLYGLYHVLGNQAISKADFGRAIARQFGYDEKLVKPILWREHGLKAPRSSLLTMRIDKLTAALGHTLPGAETEITRFHRQYLDGYPQQIKGYQRDSHAE